MVATSSDTPTGFVGCSQVEWLSFGAQPFLFLTRSMRDRLLRSKIAFPPRVKPLRIMEGWYTSKGSGIRFKLSCRFHDILRCSSFNGKTIHFHSCYNPKDGFNTHYRTLIASDPSIGIVYLPDKHGNFKCRAFVQWVQPTLLQRLISFDHPYLRIYDTYGNGLSYMVIRDALEKKWGIKCRRGPHDFLEYF